MWKTYSTFEAPVNRSIMRRQLTRGDQEPPRQSNYRRSRQIGIQFFTRSIENYSYRLVCTYQVPFVS